MNGWPSSDSPKEMLTKFNSQKAYREKFKSKAE